MIIHNTDTMAAVLERCQNAFLNYTGQELLFSRDFTKEELADRRKTLAERIGPDAHALIQGAPPVTWPVRMPLSIILPASMSFNLFS